MADLQLLRHFHNLETINPLLGGLINVDFADVKTIMQSSGSALMGIGKSSGEGRALEAAKLAIDSKLLETSSNGATGIIMNVTGGPDMTLFEVNEAASVIHDAVADDAEVIFGAVVDDRIQGEIQITIIATGFEMKNGEISAPHAGDNKLSAAGLFGGFNPSNLNSSSSFPFSGVSSTSEERPREQAPAPASSSLDIPEFLNPKNRL